MANASSDRTTDPARLPLVCSIFRLQDMFRTGPSGTKIALDDHSNAKNTSLDSFPLIKKGFEGEKFLSIRESTSGALENLANKMLDLSLDLLLKVDPNSVMSLIV